MFLGADLGDHRAGLVVRLVVDPLGQAAVRVFAVERPLDQTQLFRREDCSVFHFMVESTGWRVNRVEDYRMSLEVDCAAPNGDTIQGSASATHCH